MHLRAAHAHQAAAASHDKNDHIGAHEHSQQAKEFAREAHEHTERLLKDEIETATQQSEN
jgi:hypothetical protein